MTYRIALLAILLSSSSFAQDKIRVFITDSNSWQMSGGFGGGGGMNGVGGVGGGASGGARPQTAEIIKTFSQRCSKVTITMDRTKAQYVVLLDHEGGKEVFQKDNKIAVFKSDGDLVFTESARSLGNAVKDACPNLR